MTREDFDNQFLPKSTANKELETSSRRLLHGMFEARDFEVRDETQHDTGIDLSIELKSEGKCTNLRFAIQLKATHAAKRKKDGSFSVSVPISNINYLLNDALPAYYVLYHQEENIFLYQQAKEVDKMLSEKYPKGKRPKSFTISFHQPFDAQAIAQLRAKMLTLGYLRRNISDILDLTDDHNQLRDSIVVQKNLKVYSPSANLRYLESFGYQLLTRGEFAYIMEVEQDCYPMEEPSAKFHFVCGTAAHYTGQLTRSLDHFKIAEKHIEDLHPEAMPMMQYYTAHSKRSLGMIDRKRSLKSIGTLMDSAPFGLFLRLEKAFEEYQDSKEPAQIKISQFREKMDTILSDPSCSGNLKLTAETYLLDIRAQELNIQLLDYLLSGWAVFSAPYYDRKAYQLHQREVADYECHLNGLLERAKREGNHFTYHNICLNAIKTHYTAAYYTAVIRGTDRKARFQKLAFSEDEKKVLYEQAGYAGEIAGIFRDFSASRNMMSAFFQQYELLHLLGDLDAAGQVYRKMDDIIRENNWHGLEKGLENLKKGKTPHQRFAHWLISHYTKSDNHYM